MTVVVVAGIMVSQPVTVPHLAYPFTMTGAGAVAVEQDSLEEIAMCVEAICDCTQGQRDDDPQFGIPALLFGIAPLDITAIEQAERAREPRGQLTFTEQGAPGQPSTRQVTIDVEAA